MYCRCPVGVTGARCENVTSLMSSESSYAAVSHVWVAGVVGAFVIVAVAMVLLVYFLRRNG